jgi:signal transduction histidine kinase
MGLRTRLLLLVSLAAVPALLLVLYMNLAERRAGAAKVQKDAVRLAQLVAQKQANIVEATRQLLSGWAKLSGALSHSVKPIQDFLSATHQIYPAYADFGLIETNGVLFASSFARPEITNQAGWEHLQLVLQTRAFAIGGYQPGKGPLKPSLFFGYPVFDRSNRVARVLYAALDLAALSLDPTGLHLPEGSLVTVLDRQAHVILQYPSADEGLGRVWSNSALVSAIQNKQDGTVEMEGPDGVKRLYAFTPIRDGAQAGLFVTVGVPAMAAFADTERLLKLNLALLALVALCTWTVTWLYANRYILRPVRALNETTRQVANGDFSARTGIVEKGGELSELAEALDSMAASLQAERAETERSREALLESEQRIRELNAELEDRVRKRTAQLEQACQELEAFSYSVSHDLRAPLRPIHGYAEMLQQEVGPSLSPESRRLLSSIASAAKRMGTLIDNLLAFSRMSRSELHQAPVRMDSLLQEVQRELANETDGRAISWEIAALPEVTGDRAMLKQVWTNLLSNAVKYTRERNPARIQITCRSGPNEFEFCVQDNGAGFDMRHVNKLFGVFQRLHTGEQFEGTGIGLANVRRIIHRHGGRTWAEGKLGSGAKFYFTLPRVALPPADRGETV